jgi:predicted nuclease of predicted toxin-antitoxin system
VKLLLDENLSRRLVPALEGLYPRSTHVSAIGLERAEDEDLWRHAREHGFAIVTKDADFAERSLAEGPPPKIVWIRRGNCTTQEIETLLRERRPDLLAFESDASAPFLSLA